MEIEKTVSLTGTENGPIDEQRNDIDTIQYDIPVSRANAIAFILLQRIYSNSDETHQEDRAELIQFIERFVNQKTFSGSADNFHNFAVELARRDEYGLACDIIEAGLDKRKGGFSKNCDLLADYLQYGVNCGRTKEAKKHFKTLMTIPRRRWTWRGFSFVVYFLQHLAEQGEVDNNIYQIISSIDSSSIENDMLEPCEKVMLALVREYRKYLPHNEESYQVEAQIYEYFKEEDTALSILKIAEETLPVCPKCALRRADLLYERGDYTGASSSIHRALNDAVQTQSSVNEGYLHYLFALCIISNARKSCEKLTEELVKSVYSHFNKALLEFEEGHQSHKDVIRRNTRNIKDETGIEVSDKYIQLSALVED